MNLAQVTNSRTSTLAGQGWASKQNADNTQAGVLSQAANLASAEADVKVAEANIKAQEATVGRLKALTASRSSPPPSTAWSRPATSMSATSSRPMPARARRSCRWTGTTCCASPSTCRRTPPSASGRAFPPEIKVPQMPGRTFTGKVERSSVALLASSRTLTAQVDVPNPDRVLRPGLYVYVTLAIPRTGAPTVAVPAEALVFNQGGTRVALARDDDTATWANVHIARDKGNDRRDRSGPLRWRAPDPQPPPPTSRRTAASRPSREADAFGAAVIFLETFGRLRVAPVSLTSRPETFIERDPP